MRLDEYTQRVRALVKAPLENQSALCDELENDLCKIANAADETPGLLQLELANIAQIRAFLISGIKRAKLLNQGLDLCNEALEALPEDANEERLLTLTIRSQIYCHLADEIALIEQLNYFELAASDCRKIVEEAKSHNLERYILVGLNNLADATGKISVIAPIDDAISLLSDVIGQLKDLNLSNNDDRLSLLIRATYYDLTARLGIAKGGELGLWTFTKGIEGLEGICKKKDSVDDPLRALTVHLDLINDCLYWNIVHGYEKTIIDLAQKEIYSLKADIAGSNHPLMLLNMEICERECMMLSSPSAGQTDLLKVLSHSEIRQNIGPIGNPILFARAMIVTAWQLWSHKDDEFKESIHLGLVTLWPGYARENSIPYPAHTIPCCLINSAFRLLEESPVN